MFWLGALGSNFVHDQAYSGDLKMNCQQNGLSLEGVSSSLNKFNSVMEGLFLTVLTSECDEPYKLIVTPRH